MEFLYLCHKLTACGDMKEKLAMWDDIGLLDYIGCIEHKYVPYLDFYDYKDSVEFSANSINNDTAQTGSNLLNLFSEEEIRLADTRPVEATECKEKFIQRYNDNLINRKSLYNTYKQELGSLVTKLGLDVEKFWFLSLFIRDYCESVFYTGDSFKTTSLGQLLNLFNTIEQCSKEEPMTLKFQCGKKKVELDSPQAIMLIASLINDFHEELNQECLSQDDEIRIKSHRLRMLLSQREKKDDADIIPDSPIIVYFANMFLEFFDTQSMVCALRGKDVKHTKTEMDLVSRLVYLMGFSNNKNWNDIECEYLKSFLRQYKNYKYPDNVSSSYPEFTIY